MKKIVIFTCFILIQFLSFGQGDLILFLQKGDSLRELKEYPASYPYYDSAAINALKRTDIVSYSRALIGKGYSLRFDRENPNYEGAYQLFFQALSLLDDDVNAPLKVKQELYYGLAVTERMRGNYGVALEYGDLALILAQQLNDLNLTSKCYNMLANIQAYQGQTQIAIENSLKAVDIRESIGSINDSDLPHWYYNLGVMSSWTGALAESNRYFEKALLLFAKTQIKDLPTITVILQEIAKNYVDLGQIDSARTYYQRAMATDNQEVLPGSFVAQHFLFFGDMFKKFGKIDSALFFYQEALISSVTDFNPNSLLENPILPKSLVENWLLNPDLYVILDEKARILMDLYMESDSIAYLESAYSAYELSINLMQRLRMELDDDPSLHLAEHAKLIFGSALDVIFELQKKNPERTDLIQSAFRYVEQVKHSLLLKARVNDLGIGDELETVNRIKLIQKEIDEQRRKINLAKGDEAFYVEMEELIDQVILLRGKKEELQQEIVDRKGLAEYKFRSLSEVREYLEPNQMLINYFWGERHLYGVGVTEGGGVLRRISLEGLEDNLEAFLSTSAKLNFDKSTEDFQTFCSSAWFLSNSLISPFLGELGAQGDQKIDDLIIIPDEKINVVPFGPLLSKKVSTDKVDYKNLKYLTMEYTISYAFSSSVLMLSAGADSQMNGVVGFSSGRLKGAEGELEKVKLLWQDKATIFSSAESTESTFKAEASGYELIHIASHATAGTKELQPSITFSEDQTGQEDGQLYSYEIYPLKLQNQLTVLSACETGLGEDFEGEGVFSLARGFAFAGSRSIVTSLWKVRDKQTTEFMTMFHQFLTDGLPIKTSLRKAQLEYITKADEISSHPSFWSPFILIGNGDDQIAAERNSIPWMLWLALLVIITLFLSRRLAKMDSTV
ncbi:MAG: CHAT domain-containing tetratricopeptide repeat protein [Cyclobacteriaceae bacterium]